eukprot:TRINITY_DN17072_c0_g1_i1.p1 TRINITY_DN17072_c0_g1~~TRINITY_DN17072_c0_g1_i1.p1  ORF type:complete len:652 (-),score=134.32 TRINITY_DN17072_c0_g1_i1:395-2350(-)
MVAVNTLCISPSLFASKGSGFCASAEAPLSAHLPSANLSVRSSSLFSKSLTDQKLQKGTRPLHRHCESNKIRRSNCIPSAAMNGVKAGDDLPAGYEDGNPYELMQPRRAGILFHPTSLPGPYGIGELGKEAYTFIDWLESSGSTVWQVLPLVPPGRKSGEDGSPYSGQDANCGNTLLVSLDKLVEDGLLEASDLPKPIPVERVDYDAVAQTKDPLLKKASTKLVKSSGPLKEQLEAFRKSPNIAGWLEEAALFAAIDNSLPGTEFWWLWPEDLRDRKEEALASARKEHKDFIDSFIAEQFLFQKQWSELHDYASSKGIRIIGDMPIYVGGHSADVWANRSQFMMDPKTGVPISVSGVPPDLFSATGQLWGSPLYNWEAMAENKYQWWVQRMSRAFELYDEFRIDHFRGLAGYWAIEASAKTAMGGIWKAGPREAFFEAIKEAVGKVDIIAEDLGVITPDVVDLRKAIGAPGMAVLQFAFGSNPQNPHLPHNHECNQVVYPGTHDNDTVIGWWSKIQEKEKANAFLYLHSSEADTEAAGGIHWVLMRSAFSSVARTAVVAMQDLLGLDNSARMNTPAVQKGNWGWRIGESGKFDELAEEAAKMKAMLALYNRVPKVITNKAAVITPKAAEVEGIESPADEVKGTPAAEVVAS